MADSDITQIVLRTTANAHGHQHEGVSHSEATSRETPRSALRRVHERSMEMEENQLGEFEFVAKYLRYRYARAIYVVELSASSKERKFNSEAENIARELLLDAESPDAIRAGCHYILSCGKEESVSHATEAVSIYEQFIKQDPENAQLWSEMLELPEQARDEIREEVHDEGGNANEEDEDVGSKDTVSGSDCDDPVEAMDPIFVFA